MKYILLAAGKGSRLSPLTLSNAKALFKLDENTTLVERTIALIRKYDKKADIVIVVGYKRNQFEQLLQEVTFIYNPFFEVTNSIASLWMAWKSLFESEQAVIINADVYLDERLVCDVICKPILRPSVLVDGSIKSNGDYNVAVSGDNVIVMSKELKEYYGEYAGVTLLNRKGIEILCDEINEMVENGEYDQWYENALVRAIFMNDFKLYYIDISDYEWTEIDDINDLAYAKNKYKLSIK